VHAVTVGVALNQELCLMINRRTLLTHRAAAAALPATLFRASPTAARENQSTLRRWTGEPSK